jgi:hypothetical protein
MTTFIPADLHFKTAYGTASLGGSVNERTPTKHCCLNSKFSFFKLNLKSSGYLSFGK